MNAPDCRNIIWTNDLDYERDWREALMADYPELTEQERNDLMFQINAECLRDEWKNLDVVLSRPILIIASLGLWNGTKSGYKEISSNIRDCLKIGRDIERATWYMDEFGDLRCIGIHHDGTNHLLYRTYKEGASENQINDLKEKIRAGTATYSDITRITKRLGDAISKVYGWSAPRARMKGGSGRWA